MWHARTEQVKAHFVWHGFPCDPREFKYQSRAEIKAKAPYVAEIVYMLFDDGDWNPCMGVRIDNARDQTFNQVRVRVRPV